MVEKNLTLKDIYLLLSITPKEIGKAYISLVLSSGLRQSEALNLTIQNLIDACSNEFNFSEEHTLINLLKKDPSNITPIWVIKTSRGTKITFSSSESLFYLFIYLNQRLYENGNISNDEKLFVTGKNVLSSNEISRIFNFTEQAFHNTEKYYRVKNLTASEIENAYESYKYSSKDLRRFFAKCCETYFPEFTNEKVRLLNYIKNNNHPIKKRKLISLFYEGLDEKDKYFKEFTNNVQGLYDFYSLIHEHLTAKKYDKYHPKVYYPYPEYNKYLHDTYGDDFLLIQGLSPELNENLNNINLCMDDDIEYSIEDIKNILDELLREKYSLSLYDDEEDSKKFSRILLYEAKQDVKSGYFSNDSCYLDELIDRTKIKFDLRYKVRLTPTYVHVDLTTEQDKEEIISKLKENDFFKENWIDEELFIEIFNKYLEQKKESRESRLINPNVLGNLAIYTKQIQK